MKRIFAVAAIALVLLGANAPPSKKSVLSAKIDLRLHEIKQAYAADLAKLCEKVIAKKAFSRAKELIALVEPLNAKASKALKAKLHLAENPIIGTWVEKWSRITFICMADARIFSRDATGGMRPTGRWTKMDDGRFILRVNDKHRPWLVRIDEPVFAGRAINSNGSKGPMVFCTRQGK